MKGILGLTGLSFILLFSAPLAWANQMQDPVLSWNIKALELVVATGKNTSEANRLMALIQSAQYESIKAMYKKRDTNKPMSPALYGVLLSASLDYVMSVEAPKSAATLSSYKNTISLNEGQIDKAVKVAIAASSKLMLNRRFDGAERQESYRPHTNAGVYVPTNVPATPHWIKRRPWHLTSAKQFRAPKPPALESDIWAQDFNEVKDIGHQNSTRRNAEQTIQAQFWQATLPPIYHGVLRSAIAGDNMTTLMRSRFLAVASQAIDDAMIAVFDAKYHHAFWRPITAIRNADIDGNDNTQRDSQWRPFIPTPMHPEYPCAHCVIANTVATIIDLELGSNAQPTLNTCSYTLKGECRSWSNQEDFVAEVTAARIYDGVHYRFSGVAGNTMGAKVANYVSSSAKGY